LVKDRMALTGTRCCVDGAEAVLELRALRKNGGWDAASPSTWIRSAGGCMMPATSTT
jgi:hypothetical protein